MPTIAELLDRGTAERLAAARAEAEQRQAEESTAPAQPAACRSCGRPFAPAPVVFRSGAPGVNLNQES